MQNNLELEYRLRTNDFDQYDYILPTSILDSFQDVAGYHAEMIGMGFNDMLNKGYYWVIVRVKFTIIETPKPGSVIRVKTWPLAKDRIEFEREYKITSLDGKLLGYGSSLWVLIDSTKRRIARAKEIDYPFEPLTKKFYDSLPKLNFSDFRDNHFQYRVQRRDIDHNQHMNNSRYANVILDMLRLEENEKIESLQIDFNHEALLDDILDFYYFKEDTCYNIIALRDNDIIIKAKLEVK